MKTTSSPIASAYVRATNTHDASAFLACFSDDAVVDDAGREFRGIEAIGAWSHREIMEAKVTLDVLEVRNDRDGTLTITTRVDGDFDRTGLPDPLIMEHHLTLMGDKIAALRCRLAGGKVLN